MSPLVVFVRKSPGRSGSTKVQIAERRDGRDDEVEHVGTARTDAELAALMAAARRRLHEGQRALDLEIADLQNVGAPQRPGLITSKRSALLRQVLTRAYARLGLDAVGDEAFVQLVLVRIIEPTSKADSVRVLNEIGGHRRRCARHFVRCNEPRSAITGPRSLRPASVTR